MVGKDPCTLSEPIVGVIDRAEGGVDDEAAQSQTRRQGTDPPRIAALRRAQSAGRPRFDRLSLRHRAPPMGLWNASRGGWNAWFSRDLAPPRRGPGSAGLVRLAGGVIPILWKTRDGAMPRRKMTAIGDPRSRTPAPRNPADVGRFKSDPRRRDGDRPRLIGMDRDVDVPAFAGDRDRSEVARQGLERVEHLRALEGGAVAR